MQFSIVFCTICKVHIYQRLIRNTALFCKRLTVRNGIGIEVDRDLLFQFFGIRVSSGMKLTDVVFVSHRLNLPPIGSVERSFGLCRFSRRNDPDDLVRPAIAMTYNA